MRKCVLVALVSLVVVSQPILAGARGRDVKLDYNGDGKSELVLFEESTGAWFALTWDKSFFRRGVLGTKDYTLVPGSYDAGSAWDMAVFLNGTWRVKGMDELIWEKRAQFGYKGTTPVTGHFDRDDITDLAVYDKGKWYFMKSIGGYSEITGFGFDGGYPIAADFNGDGIDEIGVVWNDNDAGVTRWAIRYSAKDIRTFAFGPSGAIPVPGHYRDGGARANPAVYWVNDAGAGAFYISTTGGADGKPSILGLGGGDDIPVGGCDFDGDGVDDIATFTQATGTWKMGMSTAGGRTVTFGYKGTVPAGRSLYEAGGRHQPIIMPRSQGVVDGAGGFLWKPISHGGGLGAGKLLILWPTNIDPRSTISKVVVARDPAGEEVIDTLYDHGLYSSGRWKFRSHKTTGAGEGNKIYAVAIFNNGDLPKPYYIPTGADRWD